MEFRRVLFRSSNLLFAERDIPEETEKLVPAIRATRGPLIFVANEVGLGIVPDNALARRFRDAAGTINQAVAHAGQVAVFMAGGWSVVRRLGKVWGGPFKLWWLGFTSTTQ